MTRVARIQIPLALAALLAACPQGNAQDLDDFDDLVVEDAEPAEAAQVDIDPANFDQWVFGGGRTAAQGLQRLHSMLTLQVESVDRICGLSAVQKRKLEWAGRGDISRFRDEVRGVRREFMAVRRDQQKFNQLWQKISPLQAKLNSGFFGDDSLVHKVIKRTLNTEQWTTYERSEFERRRFRYQAKVALVIAMLEKGLPMSDKQRQKFLKLIVDKTDPPLRFGQYDYYVVLYQASKLPEARLRSFFDDAQWGVLNQRFRQARNMESMLRQNKFIH